MTLPSPQNLQTMSHEATLSVPAVPTQLKPQMDVLSLLTLVKLRPGVHVFSAGCTDGMVGVAARLASVQVPWPTVGEWPGLDCTNHITALEALLAEMQLRVRENQSITCV